MSFAGNIKGWMNRGLRPWNMRIESLAAEKAERSRLSALDAAGQFNGPILPVLDSFRHCNSAGLFESVRRYAPKMARFAEVGGASGYCFANDYFTSPDAEVAYALVRDLQPRRLIEVGSGNSTRLFRAAIEDGGLGTELVSIDPSPRQEIERVADHVLRKRLEEIDEEELVSSLGDRDVLFIDSSHTIQAGNDVVSLLLRIVPVLKPGVVVHLHDIFLPFEYPREWLIDFGWRWNEQYLVQALLQDSYSLEVLWPGHYLQRTCPNFADHFSTSLVGRASSLWLRKVR